MSVFQAKFDVAVWAVVSAIPRGQVMSYGEVARAAGYPRHARMVSRAMSRSEAPLPWHRVVKSDRSLAFAPESEHYQQQKQCLLEEGTRVINGKAIPAVKETKEDLDALIWGPEAPE
ncbi:MAG: cysteine methyltransferase [Proteobacteria bacterium]|nr:MAG: cysteine methyltransferase [Pseudomonadota bacterium]